MPLSRCDFNKYTLMVLQNVSELEEARAKDESDSGHDEDNDELMLISRSGIDGSDEEDVDMYSSASEAED